MVECSTLSSRKQGRNRPKLSKLWVQDGSDGDEYAAAADEADMEEEVVGEFLAISVQFWCFGPYSVC